MNDREWGSDYLTEWQGSDLYKSFTSPGTYSLTGLDYLDGQTVAVVADGVVTETHPSVITVSNTGSADGDYFYSGRTSFGNKPKYGSAPDINNDGNWYLFNGVERWDCSVAGDIPPLTGWGVGSMSSPAPILTYNLNEVGAGMIVLDVNSYTTVVVGLPFTSTLAPIYLEVENQGGSTRGTKKDVRHATIRFKDTFSAKVAGDLTGNLEDVRFDPDETPLHTGDAESWFDNESDFLKTCYIIQEDPMPCTVLAMVPNVEGR
jgi:hypothetical protein